MVKQTIQIFARVKPSVRKQQQGVRATGQGVGRVGAVGAGQSYTLQPLGRTEPAHSLSPALGTHEHTSTLVHVGLFAHSPALCPIHTSLNRCLPLPLKQSLHQGLTCPQQGSRCASIVMLPRKQNHTITDKCAHLISWHATAFWVSYLTALLFCSI